jgi:hypothetical protein
MLQTVWNELDYDMICYIYLTAVGLTPGGSSTSQIYTQTVHIIQRKKNNTVKGKLGSAGRAPSLKIIPWYLPYN